MVPIKVSSTTERESCRGATGSVQVVSDAVDEEEIVSPSDMLALDALLLPLVADRICPSDDFL